MSLATPTCIKVKCHYWSQYNRESPFSNREAVPWLKECWRVIIDIKDSDIHLRREGEEPRAGRGGAESRKGRWFNIQSHTSQNHTLRLTDCADTPAASVTIRLYRSTSSRSSLTNVEIVAWGREQKVREHKWSTYHHH